jgi:hypothetical protein
MNAIWNAAPLTRTWSRSDPSLARGLTRALDHARLIQRLGTDAKPSDVSRMPRFDGRGRDHRPRKPSDADVAPRPRGRDAFDRNQNAWEGTPADYQLSLSQMRVHQVVRTAGLTNAEAAKGAIGCVRFAPTLI